MTRSSRSKSSSGCPRTTPFTTFELSGTIGQVVQYEIVVTNTSEIPLMFSALTDPNCQNITGGPGNNPVPPGESTTYMCEHALSTVGQYVNEATVEGNEGGRQKDVQQGGRERDRPAGDAARSGP